MAVPISIREKNIRFIQNDCLLSYIQPPHYFRAVMVKNWTLFIKLTSHNVEKQQERTVDKWQHGTSVFTVQFFASTYSQQNATLPGLVTLRGFTKDSTKWHGHTVRVLPEGSWLFVQTAESGIQETLSAVSPLERSPSCFTSRKYTTVSLAAAKERHKTLLRVLPSRHLIRCSVKPAMGLKSCDVSPSPK